MASTATLTVQAGDPHGLARFYLALGFTEALRSDDAVELEHGALRLSIVRGQSGGPESPPGTRLGFQLTVRVEDVYMLRPSLEAVGAVVPTDQPAERLGVLVLDPDGNPVRLLPPDSVAADRPASTRTAAETTTAASGSRVPVDSAGGHLSGAYYTQDGVPTFDAVAERIHRESATAEGNAVLDAESERGRDESDSFDKLKKAGKDRLDQLRRSMGL